MDTWIEVAGLTIHSPVTALTNLLLAVQCAVYARRLRTGREDRGGYWSLFFLAMAVATLAGVLKHGLSYLMTDTAYLTVLWVSSLGSAASVYYAQRATLVSRATSRVESRLTGICVLQMALFLGASMGLGPEMWLVVANTAVGLAPVIVAEASSPRDHERMGLWVAGGLVVSLFTGVVYVMRLSVGPWFNHVDMAHVLMGVSFALIAKGAGELVDPSGCQPPRTSPGPVLVGGFLADGKYT